MARKHTHMHTDKGRQRETAVQYWITGWIIGFLWLCVLQKPSKVLTISAIVCLFEFSAFALLHSDSSTTRCCLHPSFSNTSPINNSLVFPSNALKGYGSVVAVTSVPSLEFLMKTLTITAAILSLVLCKGRRERQYNNQRLHDTLHSSSAAAVELSDPMLQGLLEYNLIRLYIEHIEEVLKILMLWQMCTFLTATNTGSHVYMGTFCLKIDFLWVREGHRSPI